MSLGQVSVNRQCPPESGSSSFEAIMHEQSDIPAEYRDVPVDMLKKGTGRSSHIVLVPQPTDDPNDPLNVREAVFEEPRFVLADSP